MQARNSMAINRQRSADFISRILNEIRGTVSPSDFTNVLALMLCFSEEGMMDDHCMYSPDPSNKYCFFHSEIWNALRPVWERFLANNGEDKVKAILDHIRSQKFTPSNKLNLLDNFGFEVARSEGFHSQSISITQLGTSLLNYQGGTVYNPFSGFASYGVAMKIGDKYYGEELSREAWAVGAIKLLFAKSPSHNFIQGNTFNRIGVSEDYVCKDQFNYIISTPPFGLRVPESRGVLGEEILLNKVDQLLAPMGTMVMFSMANLATKGGRTQEIRRRLTEKNLLDTVIALPKEAFSPVTSLSTIAIVLKSDRGDSPIRFLDARDCVDKKVVKVSEILSRLKNPNIIHKVSLDQIREHDYSWHPAKYEEIVMDAPKEGYKRIRLKDILCQTGLSSPALGKQRYISVSDLSTDPFVFKKDIESIEEKDGMDSRSAEVAAQMRENSEMSIRRLEEESIAIQTSIQQKEVEMSEKTQALVSLKDICIQRAQTETSHLEGESIVIQQLLNSINDEIQSEYTTSGSNGLNHEKINSLQEQKNSLLQKLDELKEKRIIREETLEKEATMEIQLAEIQLASIRDALSHDQHRLRDIQEQITTTRNRLAHSIGEIEEQAGREYIKVVYPSLLLGGKKPKVKYSYILGVSASKPLFLTNRTVSAFKVDSSMIDVEYLVYILSTLEFKDFGEMVPMISASDILEQSIDILPSIEDQKSFLAEVRAATNPLYKEREEMRAMFLAQIEKERQEHKKAEEQLIAALGSKQHDLGNLCPKITLKFAELYESIDALPDSVLDKQAMLKQIEILATEMKDMNKIIKIISEREDFPAASRVDVIQFFNEYIESHPGNGYYIEPLHYDRTELDALGESIYVKASDIALTRAILNIRENAEMHGFTPDTRNIKHFFSVSIRADYSSDTCVIDFSNNGLPMPGGMDEKRYGTKGEKAGDTAHTGNGGWYISEMAKFYGGSFHLNPKDADPSLVTIRLTLPLSHE